MTPVVPFDRLPNKIGLAWVGWGWNAELGRRKRPPPWVLGAKISDILRQTGIDQLSAAYPFKLYLKVSYKILGTWSAKKILERSEGRRKRRIKLKDSLMKMRWILRCFRWLIKDEIEKEVQTQINWLIRSSFVCRYILINEKFYSFIKFNLCHKWQSCWLLLRPRTKNWAMSHHWYSSFISKPHLKLIFDNKSIIKEKVILSTSILQQCITVAVY